MKTIFSAIGLLMFLAVMTVGMLVVSIAGMDLAFGVAPPYALVAACLIILIVFACAYLLIWKGSAGLKARSLRTQVRPTRRLLRVEFRQPRRSHVS